MLLSVSRVSTGVPKAREIKKRLMLLDIAQNGPEVADVQQMKADPDAVLK
jgi:hypothetical protein